MQLTRFSDLALRLLMYLALKERTERITARDLAAILGVPYNHLNKVVNALTKAGYVAATRGPGGGLALLRPAAEVQLGNVVLAMEPTLELVNCGAPPCALRGSCGLKDVLDRAQAALIEELNRHTLAEVVEVTRAPLLRLVPLPVKSRTAPKASSG